MQNQSYSGFRYYMHMSSAPIGRNHLQCACDSYAVRFFDITHDSASAWRVFHTWATYTHKRTAGQLSAKTNCTIKIENHKSMFADTKFYRSGAAIVQRSMLHMCLSERQFNTICSASDTILDRRIVCCILIGEPTYNDVMFDCFDRTVISAWNRCWQYNVIQFHGQKVIGRSDMIRSYVYTI